MLILITHPSGIGEIVEVDDFDDEIIAESLHFFFCWVAGVDYIPLWIQNLPQEE